MSKAVQVVTPGVPWLILAFVLLTVLKVTGHIAVSWWIVALPLLVGPALLGLSFLFVAVVFVIGLALAGIGALITKPSIRQRSSAR